jgi:hypothetical protein
MPTVLMAMQQNSRLSNRLIPHVTDKGFSVDLELGHRGEVGKRGSMTTMSFDDEILRFSASTPLFLFGCAASYQRARVNFGLQMGRNVGAQTRLSVAKQLCQSVSPLNEIDYSNHDTH